MRASARSCATACCSALALWGCSRASGATLAPAASAAPPIEAPGPGAPAAAPPPRAGPSPSAAPGPDALATARPVRSRSIGHTSYVLRLTLEGGEAAVFKPRSRLPLGDRRYRGEIAAYRLASALGLRNVPRAIPRAFPAASLRALQEGFDDTALVDADGSVRGALMPWIARYEVLPLEEHAWRARWEPWLTDPAAAVPGPDRALAAATSTLIAFDVLTGNWDRWSGANVARDGATEQVLYVDNDGAFYDPPPAGALARQLALLRRVVRFSRSFVAALRALDDARLPAVFGDESPGVPLLPARVVAAVAARRAIVLATIDARLADAGDGATLAFE